MKAAVIAFTSNGCGIALKVREALSGDDVTVQCKTNHDSDGIEHINCSSSEWTRRRFSDSDAIIFVGATGIAVRLIAPYVKSKDTDPAVVCIDEHGKFTIALLSGHIGGCNRLAERIAAGIGSVPVITTATDLNGKFAVDVFATDNRLRITDLRKAQETSSRILSGKFIGFSSEFPVSGGLPDGLTETDSGEFGLRISCDSGESPFDTTFNLVPEDIVLGIGCRRNTDPEKMYRFITDLLNGDGIDPCRVGCVASIDLKSDEK
ncbi:MAG: cobalamin biosynthesis protein, partial [Candidatus Methanomethylophilaceae archaeon]|nr:cobalamin biosynthesis protein [Candidatus Methanomethylophilaceae archaeon]